MILLVRAHQIFAWRLCDHTRTWAHRSECRSGQWLTIRRWRWLRCTQRHVQRNFIVHIRTVRWTVRTLIRFAQRFDAGSTFVCVIFGRQANSSITSPFCCWQFFVQRQSCVCKCERRKQKYFTISYAYHININMRIYALHTPSQ